MSEQRRCAFASCTPAALAIATNTLAAAPLSCRDVEIVHHPLFPSEVEYAGCGDMVEAMFQATQALLALHPSAELSMSVARERVVELTRSYRGPYRHTFSVGLVVACYQGGALCLYSAEDWLPENKNEIFGKEANAVLEKLQQGCNTEPKKEIIEIARIIGGSLMDRLHIPVSEEEVVLH